MEAGEIFAQIAKKFNGELVAVEPHPVVKGRVKATYIFSVGNVPHSNEVSDYVAHLMAESGWQRIERHKCDGYATLAKCRKRLNLTVTCLSVTYNPKALVDCQAYNL